MRIFRTYFAALIAALPALSMSVFAADWPEKPVRLIVGFGPGTPPDLFARVYGEQLSKSLKVPVVIENKPGAAGNLASDFVAKAPADGTAFVYNVSNAFTVNPYVYARLPFNPGSDLTPVATSMTQGLVLVVNNDVPVFTLKDLIDLARAEPGKLSYASYGAGSYPHLIMEWMLDETKTRMLHVPYKQGPLNEIIGRQVDMMVEPIATAYPFIQAGRVRAIAFSGEKRHPSLPNVPTFSETVPGLTVTAWHGLWAAAGTPKAIVERMNREMVRASQDPGVQRRIRDLHCEPLGVTPEVMSSMVKRDADIFSRIVRAKNIRLD